MADSYDLDRAPITLQQPRNVISLAVILGVVGVLVCGSQVDHAVDGREAAGFLALVAIFALIAIAGVIGLFRPSRLRIAQEGLIFRGTFNNVTWKWSDFSAIRVVSVAGIGGVGFEFAKSLTLGQRVAKACGAPGYWGLPTSWPLGEVELAQLLNAAKARWS